MKEELTTRKNDSNAKLIRALITKYKNEQIHLEDIIEKLEIYLRDNDKKEYDADLEAKKEKVKSFLVETKRWQELNDIRLSIYNSLEKEYNAIPKDQVVKKDYRGLHTEELQLLLDFTEQDYYEKLTRDPRDPFTAEEVCTLIEINKELEKRYVEKRKQELLEKAQKYEGKSDEEIITIYNELIEQINALLAKEKLSVSEEEELSIYIEETNIIEEFALRNTYKGKTKYGNGTLTIDRVRSGETSYDRKVLVKKLKATTEYRRVAEDSKRINTESTRRIGYLRRTAAKKEQTEEQDDSVGSLNSESSGIDPSGLVEPDRAGDDDTPNGDASEPDRADEDDTPNGDSTEPERLADVDMPSGDSTEPERPDEDDTPNGDSTEPERPDEDDRPSGDSTEPERPDDDDTPSGDSTEPERPDDDDTPSGDSTEPERPDDDDDASDDATDPDAIVEPDGTDDDEPDLPSWEDDDFSDDLIKEAELEEYLRLIALKSPCTLKEIVRLFELRASGNEEIDKIERVKNRLEKSLRAASPDTPEEDLFVFDIDRDTYFYIFNKKPTERSRMGSSTERGKGRGYTLRDPGPKRARVPSGLEDDDDAIDVDLEVPVESAEEDKKSGTKEKKVKVASRFKRSLIRILGGILGATGLFWIAALISAFFPKKKKKAKTESKEKSTEGAAKAKPTTGTKPTPKPEDEEEAIPVPKTSKLKKITLERIASFAEDRKIKRSTLEFLKDDEDFLETITDEDQFKNVCLALCFELEMNELCIINNNFSEVADKRDFKAFTFDFLCAKAIVNSYGDTELISLFGDATITYDRLMKGFMDFLTLVKVYGTSGVKTPPFEYLFDYDKKSLDSLRLLFSRLADVNEARKNGTLTSEETDAFIRTASKMFREDSDSFGPRAFGAKAIAAAMIDAYIEIQGAVSEETLYTHDTDERISIFEIYEKIPLIHVLTDSKRGLLHREQERITDDLSSMRELASHNITGARITLASELEYNGIDEKVVTAVREGKMPLEKLVELEETASIGPAVRDYIERLRVSCMYYEKLDHIVDQIDGVTQFNVLRSLTAEEAIDLRREQARTAGFVVVTKDGPKDGRTYSRGPITS